MSSIGPLLRIPTRYADDFLLHQAVQRNDLQGVLELLKAGAKVDLRTRSYETPLMVAVRCADLEILHSLIEAGADVNAKDRASALAEGKLTSLHHAVGIGHFKKTELLLKAGADVNAAGQHGNTPLMTACSKGRLDLVQLLLAFGASPNGSGKENSTPLQAVVTAFSVGSFEKSRHPQNQMLGVARELLKHGADPNLTKSWDEQTPLHSAWTIEMAHLLLEAGADIRAKSKGGYNCLMHAINPCEFETLRFFVEAGAEVNLVAENGNTPLTLAFDLIAQDFPIFLRDKGGTRLFELFINAGADVNAITNKKSGELVLDRCLFILSRNRMSKIAGEKAIEFLRSKGARTTEPKPIKRK